MTGKKIEFDKSHLEKKKKVKLDIEYDEEEQKYNVTSDVELSKLDLIQLLKDNIKDIKKVKRNA